MAVELKFAVTVETADGSARSSRTSRDGRQRRSGAALGTRRRRKNELTDGNGRSMTNSLASGVKAAVADTAPVARYGTFPRAWRTGATRPGWGFWEKPR